MNFSSLFQAGLALLLYYIFWPVLSPILQGFTGGGHFWAPLNVFMVGILPFAIFLLIALRGVRDERPRGY